MNTIATMFQAFLTVCAMDGYGNLYGCKTFTPIEGASANEAVCKAKIKEFEVILQNRMRVPYAVRSKCIDKSIGS